jgi:hypothetical protein
MAHLVIGDATSFVGAKDAAPFLAGHDAFDRYSGHRALPPRHLAATQPRLMFIGKIVSRLEMDSRWALARSVRALVAERDALKEKLEGNSSP